MQFGGAHAEVRTVEVQDVADMPAPVVGLPGVRLQLVTARTLDRRRPETLRLVFAVREPSAVKVETFATTEEPAKTLTEPFRAMILKGWKPEDPECGGAIREEEFWNIGISRSGLVFSPSLPRVIMACGEDFTIPFARLTPWLNATGQAAVASIEAEAAMPRKGSK